MFRDNSTLLPYRFLRTYIPGNVVAIGFLICFVWSPTILAQTSVQPRPSDYERQFRSFVTYSRADDLAIQRAAAYNLCQLHTFIVTDPRFSSHDKLKSLRVSIAKRLRDWQKEYEVQLKRIDRRRKKIESSIAKADDGPMTEKFSGSQIDPFSPAVDSEEYSPEEIAGFRTEPNDRDAAADTDAIDRSQTHEALDQIKLVPVFGELRDDVHQALIDSLGDSCGVMGDLSGGAGQVYEYAGANFGAPWNHSADLMALIRQVVSPDVWQTAGGNSSMFYFQPAGALVIRASQKTHDDVCELLWKLRAAF